MYIRGIQWSPEPHYAGRLQDGGDGDLARAVNSFCSQTAAHRFVIRAGEFRY